MDLTGFIEIVKEWSWVAPIIGALVVTIKGVWNVFHNKAFQSGMRLLLLPFNKLYRALFHFLSWIRNGLYILLKWSIKRAVLEIVIEDQATDNTALKKSDIKKLMNLQLYKNTIDIPKEDDNINVPPTVILSSDLKGRNDHYFPGILDLEQGNYLFSLRDISGDHWRFGARFSDSQNIPKDRHPIGFQLIHLTKNKDERILRVDQYDGSNNNILAAIQLFDNKYYDNDQLEFLVTKKAIHILYERCKLRETIEFGKTYKYANVSAWSDDGHSYSMSVQQTLLDKKVT